MKTIWKVKIEPDSVHGEPYPIKVRAKVGSVPLTVMKQGADVCLWFEVDTEAEDGFLTIFCVGTGFGSPPPRRVYLCSVVDGNHVWHFYTKKF